MDTEEEVEIEKVNRRNKPQVLRPRKPIACPACVPWVQEAPQTFTSSAEPMTGLAMDGWRRMMDIEKVVRFLNRFLEPSTIPMKYAQWK